MVCPLCGNSVKHVDGESIHVTFEKHTSSSKCDPSSHPTNIKRCPVKGCKEKLTAVSSFQCKTCHVLVCLKHRLKEKHHCGDRTKLRGGGGGGIGGVSASTGSAGAAGTSNSWGWQSSSGGSRAAVLAPNVVRPKDLPTPQSRSPNPYTYTSQREVCSVCGKSFPHLAALIAHAEQAHQGIDMFGGGNIRNTRDSGNIFTEMCPQCGARFRDVASLVAHVQNAHEGSGKTSKSKKSTSTQCLVS